MYRICLILLSMTCNWILISCIALPNTTQATTIFPHQKIPYSFWVMHFWFPVCPSVLPWWVIIRTSLIKIDTGFSEIQISGWASVCLVWVATPKSKDKSSDTKKIVATPKIQDSSTDTKNPLQWKKGCNMHIQPDHISLFPTLSPPPISVALRKLLQKPFKNPLRTLRELFGSVPEYIAHPARPYHILTYSHKQYPHIFTMSGKETTMRSPHFLR